MPRGNATLHLSIVLSERFGSQFSTGSYLPGPPFTTPGRWASFQGSLWNPQRKLDGTAFVLEVFEGDYTQETKIQRERYERYASHLALDQQPPGPEIPETSIGAVNVTPNAQPSDRSEAPFHATVHLARSDFDAALRLVDVTFDGGHLVVATLTVRSDQVDSEINRSGYPVLCIDEVDLSGGFQGFVFELRINRSVRRTPEQKPVRLPENTHLRKPAATISIAVSSVYNRYSMPSGHVEVLSCEGLINRGGPSSAGPLKGAECYMTFHEYDLAEDGCYSKESLSGEFHWDKATRSLAVDLRYRKIDLAGPLALLIFAGVSNFVRIEMTLLADLAEFKLSDQRGEISYWSVHRHRKLGDGKPKRWWS